MHLIVNINLINNNSRTHQTPVGWIILLDIHQMTYTLIVVVCYLHQMKSIHKQEEIMSRSKGTTTRSFI